MPLRNDVYLIGGNKNLRYPITTIIAPPADDLYYNNVVLLMHFDGANNSTNFVDEKGKTITAFGNAQISTSQSKFGGSGYFDGSSSYVSIPQSTDFDFSTGDFTIEFWIYTDTAQTSQFIKSKDSGSSANGIQIDLGKMGLWLDGVGKFVSSTFAIPNNSWVHTAFVRSGTNFTIYINGIADGVAVDSSAYSLQYGSQLGVGAAFYGSSLNGYLDELRITKGVARYTINFVPPTTPFFSS